MHELTRRTFLDAMGVDCYVSRSQLAGAAPTRRLLVSRAREVPNAPVAEKLKQQPAAMPKTEHAARAAAPAAPHVATSANASASISPFSFAAVSLGGWLWLEELPHRVISRDQVHLMRAMVRALGLEEGEVAVSQFDWPIHNNAQLDLTQEAAYAALGGFVYSKVEKQRCKGLVVLGAVTLKKLDISQLGIKHCVTTLSTAAMLATPALKKQVWIELQQIVGLS
ncbi:MAG: hypothetical protein ACI8QT_000731 [Halioglobus sp.]|jgi:hypothetical protein